MWRTSLIGASLACVIAGCAGGRQQPALTAEEQRQLAYLTRDPFVEISQLARDEAGNLLVVTQQGARSVRYVLAADDPAQPRLTLRPLLDRCYLEVAEAAADIGRSGQ
ncbi:MAG: hypothetical protein N3B15_00030 [Planctomycetota bacterium]|nr:hypothetical protein [Planctomycetota bacterium]